MAVRARRTLASLSLVALVLAGFVTPVHANAASPSPQGVLSPPLRDIHPAASGPARSYPAKLLPRPPGPAANRDSAIPAPQPAVAASAPATIANFAGVGQGFVGPQGTFSVNSAPPDTIAAAGPNHVVEMVNSSFAVLNKTGTVLYGPVPTNTLFSGFGGLCETDNDGDGSVQYDPIANRWLLSQFAVTGANGAAAPFLECVAVSTTGDPTGSYNRYAFGYSAFNDYPKLSVWPDAYYATFNMFNAAGTAFLGAKICAYDRTRMLAGSAATQQCFDTSTSYGGLLTAGLGGPTQPPAGSPNYVLGLGASATNSLAFWKFHVDWTTPANSTLTGPTEFPVAGYAPACGSSSRGTCIPQGGTSQQLDSLGDRLMYPLAYRNFGDHEALVASHSVVAGLSTGTRWYELRGPTATAPTVFQQGTYAPDADYRWMGSTNMDGAGDIAIEFSKSSSSIHPQIHYTGRLPGDPAGTMAQGEGTLIDGTGSQLASLNRWGDYSSISVDPIDDCTFWAANQYLTANGTFNWSTQIGSFKFPNCPAAAGNDFAISASPSSLSLAQNTSGTSTISTTVVSGSGTVALSVSGTPSGASASLNPTSVAAGGGSTLTVNAGTAAAGSYTLTVTGAEGAQVHSTTVALTVTAPVVNDFAISANPSSLSLAQNTSGTSSISTTVVSGSGTVALSVSGTPPGASASLNPTSVAAGSSSTLTVNAGTAAAGSYTLTVTGAEGAQVHSTTVALTVTAPGAGIINGGFEMGTLSGWASAGTTAVISGGAHGGTYSARVGGTSPSNGDSSIAQTFTAPAGAGNLSFWYKVVCPDTITYDWARATLRDNTTAVTRTVLAKTCTNTNTWVQVNAPVTAGHSYRLTLVSHDDNFPGDPTYTFYDDVAITAAPVNDFTISANPSSLSLARNSSGTSTISTAVASGSAGPVSLSVSGTPSGAAASLSPTSVTSGNSSTLTVNAGTAAVGSYTLTVTGTEGSRVHSTTVALTVTAPSAGIVNGGFESGSFTGWTVTGASTTISTSSHSGTYAAQAGATSPSNGDSAISQTFVAPSGVSSIGVWYNSSCPDTLTYDWAQITLMDNTAGTSVDLLAPTCAASASWTQVTGSVTPGHSYTLRLLNHDDNYSSPPDPTFTLFDDVTLQ